METFCVEVTVHLKDRGKWTGFAIGEGTSALVDCLKFAGRFRYEQAQAIADRFLEKRGWSAIVVPEPATENVAA